MAIKSNIITDLFQIGDMFHCQGNGIIAKGIGFSTKHLQRNSDLVITHTAGFIKNWNIPQICDSQKDGFNARDFEKWVAKYGYKYIVTRRTDKFDPKEFAKRATLLQGTTGYDFENLFIRQPWRLLTGNFKKKKNESEKMVCSESQAFLHGYPIELSPIELFNYVIEEEKHEIIFQNF